MADIKTTTRRDFPEVRGKIVDRMEVAIESGYYGIAIHFEDKTGLTFSIEPGLTTFPEYSDWTDGQQNTIKEYEPLHSKGLRSK